MTAEENKYSVYCDEVQRYTGFSPETSGHILVAITASCLVGLQIKLGHRTISLSLGLFLPQVNSYTQNAIALAELLFISANEPEGAATVFISASANIMELSQSFDDAKRSDCLRIFSTETPFHPPGSGAKGQAAMDWYVRALRACFHGPFAGFTHLWHTSQLEYANCCKNDPTGGFVASTSIIPISLSSEKIIPPPQISMHQTAISKFVCAAVVANGEIGNIEFDPSATTAIEAVATGRDDFNDVIRQVASYAASLHFLYGGIDRLRTEAVSETTVENAIDMWRESLEAKESVLEEARKNQTKTRNSALTQSTAVRLWQYAQQNKRSELSARDVSLTKIAKNVKEARLLLVHLEMMGLAQQNLTVKEGRAHQTWEILIGKPFDDVDLTWDQHEFTNQENGCLES